jgi:hypothetical protein
MLFACENAAQKNLQKQQGALTGQEQKTSEFGLEKLKDSLPGVLDFFQNLMKGGPNAMTALTPAISSLTSQYENSAKAESEFAPRGGGATAALEEAPFKQASDIANLVASEQTAGATGMENLDQLLANLTTGSASTALGGNLAQQDVLQQQQQTQQAQAAQAGQAVGAVIALLTAA